MNNTEETKVEEVKEEQNASDVKIVQTDTDSKDGQTKCPKCGATDISTNVNTGKLRCNFCRHEFEPIKLQGMEKDLKNLKGQVMTSGTQNIVADTKDVVTLKCSSCGAEVVIDTASSTQARCHWCRNKLSINSQVQNGAVPDVVLPFTVKKNEARTKIEAFVGKRKFYAHPKFKAEFTTENIMGVYFPYMLVDVNSHALFKGQGEHQIRSYSVGTGDNRETRYDAELYNVEREFDLVVDGLSVESSSDRLNTNNKEKTNNIINSIMPFDVENCVKYDSNYLTGYTSEKRDTNVEQLKPLVDKQAKDVARFAANDSLKQYDRGVAWSTQNFDIKGEQWKAAYLPVWLYSYQQVSGNKKLLHYVAVNARTKETMGSVPIYYPKLILISFLVEVVAFLFMITALSDVDNNWLVLVAGIIYFMVIYFKYRNTGARHSYETETKKEVTNLRKVDDFVKKETGLSNATMRGANNKALDGVVAKTGVVNKMVNNDVMSALSGDKSITDVLKDQTKK